MQAVAFNVVWVVLSGVCAKAPKVQICPKTFVHDCTLVELEFGDVGFSGGRKRELGQKPFEQGDNQQQTQPKALGWNRTWATLMEGSTLTTAPSLLFP